MVSTFVLLDRNVNALTLTWFIWFICFNLSPLKLWVRIPLRRGVLDTTLCDKVCQWLAAGRWFSPGTLVSSNNKTDLHDVTEILLKVALNTINLYVSNFTFPQYCNVNLPHAFYFGFQSFEYEIKVPDEGYSRNWSCELTANYKTVVHLETNCELHLLVSVFC